MATYSARNVIFTDQDNVKVGINTAPDNQLHIHGITGGFTDGIKVSRSAQINQALYINNRGSVNTFRAREDGGYGYFSFGGYDGTTETDNWMYINNLGNIGIGTISPPNGFYVEETLAFGGTNADMGIMIGSTSKANGVGARHLMGFGYNASSADLPNFAIGVELDDTTDDTTGDFLFRARNGTVGTTGSTEVVRITHEGDVGIGTSTINVIGVGGTTTVLEVHKPGGAGVLELTSDQTADNTVIGILEWGTTASSGQKGAGAITMDLEGSGATNASANMRFFTNNAGAFTERMVITSTGNIGVATVTPLEKFHCTGNAIVTGNVGIGTTNTLNAELEIAGNLFLNLNNPNIHLAQSLNTSNVNGQSGVNVDGGGGPIISTSGTGLVLITNRDTDNVSIIMIAGTNQVSTLIHETTPQITINDVGVPGLVWSFGYRGGAYRLYNATGGGNINYSAQFIGANA